MTIKTDELTGKMQRHADSHGFWQRAEITPCFTEMTTQTGLFSWNQFLLPGLDSGLNSTRVWFQRRTLLGYWDQLTGSGAGLIPFSNRTSLGLLSVQQDAAKPNWQPGYHCLFIWIQTEKESSHIKTFYFGSDGGGPGFCLSSALWPS